MSVPIHTDKKQSIVLKHNKKHLLIYLNQEKEKLKAAKYTTHFGSGYTFQVLSPFGENPALSYDTSLTCQTLK